MAQYVYNDLAKDLAVFPSSALQGINTQSANLLFHNMMTTFAINKARPATVTAILSGPRLF
jgi:hypothetical protein